MFYPECSSELFNELLSKFNGSKNNSDTEIEQLKVFTGKRVLITGAAGSIGSEISKKVSSLKPDAIALLDINESGLNDLKFELQDQTELKIKIYLCDVSREDSLKNVFLNFKPDIVFHVAAYKHIHILENFPEEALRVNILGTFKIASLSMEFNVSKFVFISTDKAVNPISIMGKSKRAAEIILNRFSKRNKTDFIIARLCNVIGSRGSVSEIFIRQIIKGGPVTLTHPEMIRYFITLPQAACLALKAAEFGENGCVYIPRMENAIKITELLNELIMRFSSTSINKPKVIITGTREGEKLSEELWTSIESNYLKAINGFIKVDNNFTWDDNLDDLNSFSVFDKSEYVSVKNLLFNSIDLN